MGTEVLLAVESLEGINMPAHQNVLNGSCDVFGVRRDKEDGEGFFKDKDGKVELGAPDFKGSLFGARTGQHLGAYSLQAAFYTYAALQVVRSLGVPAFALNTWLWFQEMTVAPQVALYAGDENVENTLRAAHAKQSAKKTVKGKRSNPSYAAFVAPGRGVASMNPVPLSVATKTAVQKAIERVARTSSLSTDENEANFYMNDKQHGAFTAETIVEEQNRWSFNPTAEYRLAKLLTQDGVITADDVEKANVSFSPGTGALVLLLSIHLFV